jgi:hypothetical protein
MAFLRFQQLECHSAPHSLHSPAWLYEIHRGCPKWLKLVSRSTTRHAEIRSLTDIIWVTPSESHLQVVILTDHRIEFLQQIVGLVFGQAVDLLSEGSKCENALRSSHRVGPDNRMHCTQRCAHVLWRSARTFEYLHFVWEGFGRGGKSLALEGSGQGLEEVLIGRRELIIQTASRRPQSVTASRRYLGQAQAGIIRRVWLKLYIGMPLRCVVPFWLTKLTLLLEHVFLRSRRDVAHLRVTDTEFRGAVENRMHVERILNGLARHLAQAINQLLLLVVRQVILRAEEHNATLRDWCIYR